MLFMKEKEDFQELFVCRCEDIQHQFVLHTVDFKENPQVYLSVFLYPYSFFKRVLYGIKYIFGHRSIFGYFDEIILKPDDADRLQVVVDKLREVKKLEENSED